MDSVPIEVLQLVVIFALPTASTFSDGDVVRRCMQWVARLRLINSRWKTCFNGSTSCLIWFHAAEALGLEPPKRLYYQGTHQEVCKLLVQAEGQRHQVLAVSRACRELWLLNSREYRQAPKPRHPHPDIARIRLSPCTRERIAKNAQALKFFLESLDYWLEMGHPANTGWHESAWIRYHMFLHLKRTYPSIWFVPTLDIQYCWLAHLFQTETYWKDMSAMGVYLDHTLYLASYGQVCSFSKAVKATATLWNKTFGIPYLPPDTDTDYWDIWVVNTKTDEVVRNDTHAFFPVMVANTQYPTDELSTTSLTLEDIQGFDWQGLHKVFWSLKRFGVNDNDSFEHHVLASYERLLHHAGSTGTNVETLPPSARVLHMAWLAHQLDPTLYKEDCTKLFGREWRCSFTSNQVVPFEFHTEWHETYRTTLENDWRHLS